MKNEQNGVTGRLAVSEMVLTFVPMFITKARKYHNVRRDFLVCQYQPEHSDGAGECQVVTLHIGGDHKVAEIIEGVGHFVVGEGDLFLKGDGGRAVAVVGDDHEAVGGGGEGQGDGAEIVVRIFLRHRFSLCAVGAEDSDVQTGAEVGDVGGGASGTEQLLFKLRHVQDDVGVGGRARPLGRFALRRTTDHTAFLIEDGLLARCYQQGESNKHVLFHFGLFIVDGNCNDGPEVGNGCRWRLHRAIAHQYLLHGALVFDEVVAVVGYAKGSVDGLQQLGLSERYHAPAADVIGAIIGGLALQEVERCTGNVVVLLLVGREQRQFCRLAVGGNHGCQHVAALVGVTGLREVCGIDDGKTVVRTTAVAITLRVVAARAAAVLVKASETEGIT